LRIGASVIGTQFAKMRWGGSYFMFPGAIDWGKVSAYLTWRWA
jgi:hypothetical protein